MSKPCEGARLLVESVAEYFGSADDEEFLEKAPRDFQNVIDEETAPLRAENVELREQVNDIAESHRRIMNEECDAGDVHCTCVPVLRTEVERLRKALDFYGNVYNWKRPESPSGVIFDSAIDKAHGKVAREALDAQGIDG